MKKLFLVLCLMMITAVSYSQDTTNTANTANTNRRRANAASTNAGQARRTNAAASGTTNARRRVNTNTTRTTAATAQAAAQSSDAASETGAAAAAASTTAVGDEASVTNTSATNTASTNAATTGRRSRRNAAAESEEEKEPETPKEPPIPFYDNPDSFHRYGIGADGLAGNAFGGSLVAYIANTNNQIISVGAAAYARLDGHANRPFAAGAFIGYGQMQQMEFDLGVDLGWIINLHGGYLHDPNGYLTSAFSNFYFGLEPGMLITRDYFMFKLSFYGDTAMSFGLRFGFGFLTRSKFQLY